MSIRKRPDKIVRESAALPDAPIGSEDEAIGTVKWWLEAKGYGVRFDQESFKFVARSVRRLQGADDDEGHDPC